jgi:DUF4097 and DUF4098 domain-containing protein YvlB
MRPTRLFLVGAAGALLLPLAALHAQGERQRVDTSFTFDRGGSVRLGIVSGEIRVVAGSTNEVRISASIDRGRFETSFSRTSISIEARSINNRMGETRIEMTVPVGTRVRAASVSGDVTVRGTQSEVEVSVVSGNVTIEDAASSVHAGTVSGDLELIKVSGRLELSTVSGDLRARDVEGDLGAESVSGNVEVRDARVRTLRGSSVSGDITYAGTFARDGDYRFNSHSGSILFSLPANAGANLEMETFSGRINSDFPVTLQPGESVGRRGRRMQFTLGAGGTRISAETFSGDITIRRTAARDEEE